jgi:hypothetical protein
VNDIATGAPLDILAANAAPIVSVPVIMDLDLLPDMGRMTGRLPVTVATGISTKLIPEEGSPPGSDIA